MKLVSAASYPTIGDIYLVFLNIQDHLNAYIKQDGFFQTRAAVSMNQKIEEYWSIMDKPFIVSAVLDPCTKLKIFDIVDTVNAKKVIQEAMNQYIHEDRQVLSTSDNVPESPIKTARKFFWNMRN